MCGGIFLEEAAERLGGLGCVAHGLCDSGETVHELRDKVSTRSKRAAENTHMGPGNIEFVGHGWGGQSGCMDFVTVALKKGRPVVFVVCKM